MNKPPIVVVVNGGIVQAILGPAELHNQQLVIVDLDLGVTDWDNILFISFPSMEPLSNLNACTKLSIEDLEKHYEVVHGKDEAEIESHLKTLVNKVRS